MTGTLTFGRVGSDKFDPRPTLHPTLPLLLLLLLLLLLVAAVVVASYMCRVRTYMSDS